MKREMLCKPMGGGMAAPVPRGIPGWPHLGGIPRDFWILGCSCSVFPQAGLQGHAAAGIWDPPPPDGVWVAKEHDAIQLCHEGELPRACSLMKCLDFKKECSCSVLGGKKIGKDYPSESWLRTRQEQMWAWGHITDDPCPSSWTVWIFRCWVQHPVVLSTLRCLVCWALGVQALLQALELGSCRCIHRQIHGDTAWDDSHGSVYPLGAARNDSAEILWGAFPRQRWVQG